ncbi:MAG: glycosyltransferase family 2 protein, partial [Elusimicrobiota bacterium]
MKLSVVIPAYNEEDTVKEVIDKVESVPVDKEIVVVDDASTDGTRDILKNLDGPGIKVILKDKNG